MRFKKVFLVHSARGGFYGPTRPHLGLGYIAQALSDNGIEYDTCDMLFNYSIDDLANKISKFSPDLIGFNMYTFQYLDGYKFFRDVKSRFPNVPIIVGGPHITTFAEEALKECEAIDYGAVREGEDLVIELCRGKDEKDIAGLIYRDKGLIVKNQPREFNAELDRFQIPKFEKFEMKRYIPEIPMLSTRGCPYSCTFCQVDAVVGKKFRSHSPENIVARMQYWYDKGYRRFNFMDDNFTLVKKRVHQICDLIEASNMKDLFMRCAGVRCDRLDEDMLRRMYKVGFRTLSFGVEGGNDKMLKLLKKGERLQEIENAIKVTCEIGFDVTLFFLIGSPGETRADVNDSFRLAMKYPVFRVNFYNIIPYPNTEIFEWIKEKGYFLREPREYLNSGATYVYDPIFKTDEMTTEEKVEALHESVVVKRKVLQNAVERRLNAFKIKGFPARWLAYILSRGATERFIFKLVPVRKIFEFARHTYHILNSRQKLRTKPTASMAYHK